MIPLSQHGKKFECWTETRHDNKYYYGSGWKLERIFFPVTQLQTGHFVSGDLKSFFYARLASFSLRG